MKTTLRVIFIAVMTLHFAALSAQDHVLDWVNAGDFYGNASTIDASGNIYTTGYFQGTVDFDPGPGTFYLTSQAERDIFILKLDPDGNFIWARAIGGTGVDEGWSIATDPSGNTYIEGRYVGTVDFDPGVGTYNLTTYNSTQGLGGYDLFTLKLDSNGNFVWANSLNGGNYNSSNLAYFDGAIYTTGYFSQTVDFDPGPGTYNLTSAGSNDIFIQKLDTAGNFVWAIAMGSTTQDIGYAITVDETGYIYTTGFFTQTVDFDPGIGTYNLTPTVLGNNTCFIQKLDTAGNFVWAKSMGGASGVCTPQSITTDNLGNIYTTGEFLGTIDFQPGPGSHNLTATANEVFIQKLDASGNFQWAKEIDITGGFNLTSGYSITTDNLGNVYTTGSFSGTADFDPGPGINNISSPSFIDIFILKLDALGNFSWVKNMEIGMFGFSFSIITDTSGNLYTTGSFNGGADLDPGPGTINTTTEVGYILKLKDCSNTGTDVVTACDSYLWIDGNTYTSSNNTATYTLTNVNNCDSVVTLNLTINNSSTSTDVISACGSYLWIDGNNYTSSNNTATYTLTNEAGCDSLVTLDLTIHNSTTGTDVVTACDSYLWIDGNTYTSNNNTATYTLTNIHGCDSLVTLDLTINNSNTGTDVVTACDSYLWIDGNTYTSSNNTATYTITNEAGCDSLVTLDLTIKYSTTGTDVITACDSYTWIDGNTYTSSNNSATYILTNTVGCDSIVTLDLTIYYSNTGTDVITACDAYTWIDGNTYTASNNTATYTLTNVHGCDSVVTLNLTINYSNTGTDVITACDFYTWIDGNTYTSSNNTATYTLTNAAGCDSVVTLDLTIYYNNSGTDVITACDSYTWIDGITYTTSNNTATSTVSSPNGCESIITLDLTITHSNTGTDVISACDSFTWIDGNTYTESNNTATYTLTNVAGCDSVVTLDLTINTVDVSVIENGITLTANLDGASYQWIDCNDNNNPIVGETNQSYTATADGSYAVIVDDGNCVGTSICYAVIGVDAEAIKEAAVNIYPNPTNGIVFVQGEGIEKIVVTDVNGRVIEQVITSQQQVTLDLTGNVQGIYFVNIETKNGRIIRKVLLK